MVINASSQTALYQIFKMATDYLPRESAFEIPTLALVKNTSYYFTEKTGHCINGSLSLHQINYKCKG